MANPANIRETLLIISKKKQANATTPSIAGDMISVRRVNPEITVPVLVTENNASEIGGGSEFATERFGVNWELQGRFEKFLTSEWAGFVFPFSMGGIDETGDGTPEVYTCVLQDPIADGIELPYFTLATQIRPGGSQIIDVAAIGCMVTGWQLNILSGPGRASSKLVADFVGIGKFATPSTISAPDQLSETLLSSASLALTLNSVNYISSKKIQSLEATLNNSPRLDRRFHPGSGTQSGAAIGSRIEFGDRVLTLKFVADFESDSTELATMLAGTEFSATFSLTTDANNSVTFTYPRLAFKTVTPTNTDGIVSVDAECDILLPQGSPLEPILTVVVNTTILDFAAAP